MITNIPIYVYTYNVLKIPKKRDMRGRPGRKGREWKKKKKKNDRRSRRDAREGYITRTTGRDGEARSEDEIYSSRARVPTSVSSSFASPATEASSISHLIFQSSALCALLRVLPSVFSHLPRAVSRPRSARRDARGRTS